ncbi:MAG: response regulator transcription factor [Chitinophagales bacterium]|nr:response regulator transcription factor [Chitinophagaceae bacterium]MCB9065778.1 response regulator transcription factor [Chitinophagales bacterium]
MQEFNINICLIEDDETIREGYEYLINNTEGYKVTGSFPSYEDAAKKIARCEPDVILLDVELPGVSGIDAIPKLKKLVPEAHVIILTVYEQELQIFRALGNGAAGYMTKDTPHERILTSIKEVMSGGGPMSSQIARMVIQSFQRNEESPLTPRETEILEQISTGKSRKRIAEELFIDLETVKSHIKNIYSKLNVHSKADAIKLAKDNKFI